jgi:hypothetical protein
MHLIECSAYWQLRCENRMRHAEISAPKNIIPKSKDEENPESILLRIKTL